MIERGDALKYVTRCQTSIRHRALPSVIIHLRADGSRAALMMVFPWRKLLSHRCNMFSETLRNVKLAAAQRNAASPEFSSASMRELLAGSVIARTVRPTHPEHSNALISHHYRRICLLLLSCSRASENFFNQTARVGSNLHDNYFVWQTAKMQHCVKSAKVLIRLSSFFVLRSEKFHHKSGSDVSAAGIIAFRKRKERAEQEERVGRFPALKLLHPLEYSSGPVRSHLS